MTVTSGGPGRVDPDLAPPDTPLIAAALAVFAGGIVGGLAREGVAVLWPGGRLPWAILLVNVVGSFVLGVVVEIVAGRLLHRHPRLALRLTRPLLGTGFCGAFTTFSSLAVALSTDLRDGHIGVAAVYLGLSLVLGLAATVAGMGLGRRVAR